MSKSELWLRIYGPQIHYLNRILEGHEYLGVLTTLMPKKELEEFARPLICLMIWSVFWNIFLLKSLILWIEKVYYLLNNYDKILRVALKARS